MDNQNSYVDTVNPFSVVINELFTHLNIIYGTLYHVNSLLQQDIINFEKRSKENQNGYFVGAYMVLSDVSGETENGWKLRFPADGKFSVKGIQYKEEIEKLLFNQTGHSLIHAYEFLITFIKKSVRLDNSTKFTEGKHYKNAQWFQALYDNNNNLLNALKVNNSGINLIRFIETLNFVRDKLTHNNGQVVITDRYYKELNSEQLKILNKHFPFSDLTNNTKSFQIPVRQGMDTLIIITEYAYQIFKFLSINNGYNWQSPVKKPLS